jgi:hypothetical protein
MGRLLLLSIFVFGASSCSFISKRIESREKRESPESSSKPALSSDEQLTQIRIRDLERQLKSQREKELYSKLLPWFKDEDEKLEYLSLSTLEDKQEWANDKKIWSRARNPNDEMRNLMQNQDIAIGMPMDFVLKAWGDPAAREVSGNHLFKNEKWKYVRSISTSEGFKQEKRTVYFEGGKVVGWETD